MRKMMDFIFFKNDCITVAEWYPRTNHNGQIYRDRSYTDDVLEIISIDEDLMVVRNIEYEAKKDAILGGKFILNTSQCAIRKISREFAETIRYKKDSKCTNQS